MIQAPTPTVEETSNAGNYNVEGLVAVGRRADAGEAGACVGKGIRNEV